MTLASRPELVRHLVGPGHHFGEQTSHVRTPDRGNRVRFPFICIGLVYIAECKYGGRIRQFQAAGGDMGSASILPSESIKMPNVSLICAVGDAFLQKPLQTTN